MSRQHPPLAAVLWDLDGTLIDTAPDLAAAVNAMRIEQGLDALPLERLRHLASFGARGMLGGGFGVEPGDADYDRLRERFIELYREGMTRFSKPFPGIREAIAGLATDGLAWGVVTNKYESLAVPLLEAMAFEPPPVCVVGGDSAEHAKPHPAPLLLACERAGLDPTACCYVGDSDRDIAAGRAAGMRTVAAAYGYIAHDVDVAAWQADAVIREVAELPAVIAALAGNRSPA